MLKGVVHMVEEQKAIEHVVRSLGLSGRALSSRQLILAVELAYRDRTLLQYVTKGLYIEVAAKCGHSNWKSVERNLRIARDRAWERADRGLLNQLAGYELKGKPTTGEFIDMLCHRLDKELRFLY